MPRNRCLTAHCLTLFQLASIMCLLSSVNYFVWGETVRQEIENFSIHAGFNLVSPACLTCFGVRHVEPSQKRRNSMNTSQVQPPKQPAQPYGSDTVPTWTHDHYGNDRVPLHQHSRDTDLPARQANSSEPDAR